MRNIRIYLLAWPGLVAIAILNGILRTAGYSRYMSDLTAHQVSTFTGIILFGLFVWILSGKWPLNSVKESFIIGTLWMLLAVAFEFLFGRFVMDHSWNDLFQDYNLFQGRLWVLVLLWTWISPYFFYRITAPAGE